MAIVIGNRHVQRAFAVEDGRLRTLWFANAKTGSRYAVGRESEEFAVEFMTELLRFRHGGHDGHNHMRLTARDFRVVSAPGEGELSASGVFELFEPKLHMRLWIEVSADGERPWLRKRLRFSPARFETASLHRFEVESLQWEGPAPRHGGFGQPLLGPDWFAGVEYPAGDSKWQSGTLTCGHYAMDRLLVGEEAASESAVFGATERDGARAGFLAYIEATRCRPIRRYMHYNSWYDLRQDDLNEPNLQERIIALDRELVQKRGARLDGFVLDDGWDVLQSVWEIEPTRFPDGFASLIRTLEPKGIELGIWFGPSGGYSRAGRTRIGWYESQGFEVTATKESLCLAGTRYHGAFLEQLRAKLRMLPLGYIKLDGIPFACNEPHHGHPVGIQSREALMRAFIRVLETIRSERPDAFVSITTGAWLSPWWLRWADAVFIGGHDYAWATHLPTHEDRAAAITYRDSVMYEDFRVYEDLFPLSSLMTVGVIKGELKFLGGADESLEAWKTELLMEVGRGVGQTELYLSPHILKGDEWDELAQAIRWAREHDDVLLGHGEMVLGDPNRGEPYGYIHRGARECIAVLRNPSHRPQWVEWQSSWVRGLDGGPHVLWQLYPECQAVSLDAAAFDGRLLIGPFEALMFHARPLGDRPGIVALNVPIAVTGEDEAIWYVPTAGDTDSDATVHVVGPCDAELELEAGRRICLSAGEATVHMGIRSRADGSWSVVRPFCASREWDIKWKLGVDVDHAELFAVGEWEGSEGDHAWTVAGEGTGTPRHRSGKGASWSLARVPLSREGALRLTGPAASGRVSLWISTKRARRPVTVRSVGATMAGANGPVTAESHLERQTHLLWEGPMSGD